MVLPLGDLHQTRITPVVTYALDRHQRLVYLVQVQRGDAVHHGIRMHAVGGHAQRGH